MPNIYRVGAVALLLMSASTAFAKPVKCPDPEGEGEIKVKVPAVKRGLKKVKKQFEKRGIHMLDLSDDVQQHRSRLDVDLAEDVR